MDDDRLAYSPSDAADILGCSRAFLYTLMVTGELPSCKIGSRRFVRRADLQELLDRSVSPLH